MLSLKAVVVTEASIRSSLLFNDVDGTACLINEAIFKNLALMGYEGDQPPVTESSSSHDTTQDSRDSLEGTNGSKGDQVQSPNDSPLSGDHTSDRAEGALNLEELFFICTNLSNRVLALETVEDAQAVEIIALKARIKKMEKKCKPRVCIQQGRKKDKPRPTLDDSIFDDLDDDLDADLDVDHGMDYMDIDEPVNGGRISKEITQANGCGEKGGSDVELVSATRPEDSTVRPDVGTGDPIAPPTTTTSIFDDEDITMAQTLIKMKEEKAKEKEVSIKDIEDSSRHARSILTLKPLPTIDPKDKCKGVLEELEPVKKMTRSDLDDAQIAKDAEIARLVYEEELAELERENEKRQREEEASKAAIVEMYDEVQAGIEADALFTAKLQQEERKEPPTKFQLRNLMIPYLKNMGGYKYSHLKAKTFAKIQGLYERQKRVIDDFKPMDLDDAVDKEKVLEELDSTKVKVKQEGDEESIKKRPGRRLKMKATKKSKRQKTDSDLKEEEHLKTFLSDGSSRWIKTFFEMVTRFVRMDLEELYNPVMQRVHTLTLEDGTKIYMLAERRYLLIKETLEMMSALRLIAKSKSEAVFYLLRFIKKQIDESRSHDGSEKDFKDLASPKQMALGKDILNLLIVDSLLKPIWLLVHHVIAMNHWLV
nr:hypothetical protein [Tanacetum cinerariifolium]